MKQTQNKLLVIISLLTVISQTACGTTTQFNPTRTTTSATAIASRPATAVAKPTSNAAQHPSLSTPKSSTAHDSSHGVTSFRVAKGDNSIPNYGKEAHVSERQRATTALAAFLQARANGQWSEACTYLTSTTRDHLIMLAKNSKGAVTGCGPMLATLLNGSPATRANPLTTAGIAALRIKNNGAFALCYSHNGSKFVMPMQNENGIWKISQLTPIPYPLGIKPTTTTKQP